MGGGHEGAPRSVGGRGRPNLARRAHRPYWRNWRTALNSIALPEPVCISLLSQSMLSQPTPPLARERYTP
eukprot:4054941-Alexandrium_andersonii.AAC.1